MARRAGKPLKEMTPEELRAYHREASERSRLKHPDYKERARERRLAKIAAETPEERAEREERLRVYRASRRERTAELARAWRAANPEKAAATARRYRHKDIEAARARERANGKKHYAKRKPLIVAHNRKRRALINGATRGEAVRHDVVAERDGWRCHICRKKVTRATWSLDHLVPLADGGEHSYANVSLAHNVCNKRRWKGILPAQLRLFG